MDGMIGEDGAQPEALLAESITWDRRGLRRRMTR